MTNIWLYRYRYREGFSKIDECIISLEELKTNNTGGVIRPDVYDDEWDVIRTEMLYKKGIKPPVFNTVVKKRVRKTTASFYLPFAKIK